MADRWAVVECLRRGLPYREIHRQTGVSVTTIGRVARYLAAGQWRLCAGGAVPRRRRTDPLAAGGGSPWIRTPACKLAVQKSGRLTDPSLDLLARCGLKLSRGKDQLMGFGENMPLDVLFVRDDDIPDLVQEDVCDLGLVGLNVLEEKRLELAARGTPARFETLRTLDFGRCRLSLAVPDGAQLRRPALAAGQAHRHHLSVPARRASCEQRRHRGRDRHAVGRRGDRAAPGARRC